MDTETYNHLLKQEINTKLVHGEILKRSGTGWKFRFQTMYELLKEEIFFIVIWMQYG